MNANESLRRFLETPRREIINWQSLDAVMPTSVRSPVISHAVKRP